MYPAILRRIVLPASWLGLAFVSGCFRSASGECNPFNPPPPYITPTVTTAVSGTISVTFDGVTAAVGLDGAESASAPACSAEINGEPTIQTLSIVCIYPPIKNAQGEVVSQRYLNIGYGSFDLRQLPAGDTRATVTIDEWKQGVGSGCTTTLERAITIIDAAGSAAAAPSYVTADYVRKGLVTLDVDPTQTGTWTASQQGDVCSAPSLVIHLSATFTQRPGDYTEVSSPSCNLDISK